jgi:uncharacterized protein with NRDE domain
MCTVTYIPTKNGVIFTSNRDEAKSRSTENLIKYEIKNKIVCFPPDAIGGTWIGCNSQGEILCLLNGAYTKHRHKPPYKHSRGLLVKTFLESNKSINELLHDAELDGIEPFTLIYLNDNKLIELRWDERIKHIKTLNKDHAYMWSSCTLYSDEIQKKKEQLLKNHIKNTNNITPENILSFHKSKPFGDGINDLIMDRDFVATISITQLVKNGENMKIDYYNLLNDNTLSTIVDGSNN